MYVVSEDCTGTHLWSRSSIVLPLLSDSTLQLLPAQEESRYGLDICWRWARRSCLGSFGERFNQESWCGLGIPSFWHSLHCYQPSRSLFSQKSKIRFVPCDDDCKSERKDGRSRPVQKCSLHLSVLWNSNWLISSVCVSMLRSNNV